jgi:hypothetical protein
MLLIRMRDGGGDQAISTTPKNQNKRKSIGALERNQHAKGKLFQTSSFGRIAFLRTGLLKSEPKIVVSISVRRRLLCGGGGKATTAVLSWRVRRYGGKAIKTFNNPQYPIFAS